MIAREIPLALGNSKNVFDFFSFFPCQQIMRLKKMLLFIS